MENPFLIQKYPDLPGSKPVESAVKQARKSGEKVHDKPERVEVYLDRLERLVLDPDKGQETKQFAGQSRPRALSLLREILMNKYVRANKEKMAEGAARVEERAARDMGIHAQYGEREIQQRGEIAVEDLEKSLDNWISYLSDANEPYPVWFRYYAFRNILDLGDYDKDKKEFPKRSQGTARLFPDIDRGALAYAEDMIEASRDQTKLERLRRAQETAQTPQDLLVTKDKVEKFAKLPFAKQYAEGIAQAGEITPEMREETRGAWVKYQQGTNPTALWASLQNKGTAWCTKGFATADTQLKGGDFHVYYTLDRQGKPTIPRIAIRMQGDTVGEVRGVADNQQNVEENMLDIAQSKYHDLPGGESYEKKDSDMKRMKALVKKQEQNQPFDEDDLRFLYELDAPIESFGYDRDKRIDEVKSKRDGRGDLRTIFGCTEKELEEKEHNRLEDVPTFAELPSEAVLKGYKFDWIWKEEYREGRGIKDFSMTEKDLEKIGVDDRQKLKELLQAAAQGRESKEVERMAKVFDIGEAIAKKKKEDPGRPGHLTTKEVLEAIDQAGYRPATLEELLAFGKQHWKPEADPKTLTDEEKLLQRVNSPYIYAFGSPFADSGGSRRVPSLCWGGGERDLNGLDLGRGWIGARRFLVLRKVSS